MDCWCWRWEASGKLLKAGDYILALNGKKVTDKDNFTQQIQNCGGEECLLTIRRGEEELEVCLTPVPDQGGAYKLGIWIRDKAQGVGTLTYLDRNGHFGALGHGINDIDTVSVG